MPLSIILYGIDVFLLIFVRMTGLFVMSPVFGRRNIPTYFKIGFSFLLALIFVNTGVVSDLTAYDSIWDYAVLIAREFIVGITIGYVSYLMFSAIYFAGQIIDMEIGFGVVNILDPTSNIQVPVTSNFYFIISMLVFLAVNGHHTLIKAIFESYSVVPLGEAVFSENLVQDITRIVGSTFAIGFKIAAPVTAAALIADVALGVISKTIPQINVFMVGIPLKIILGIAVLVITMPVFLRLIEVLFDGMNGEMTSILRNMGAK